MFETKPFASEVDNLKLNNRFLRMTVAALLIMLIIVGIGLLRSMGNERTILVPPEFHKTVWVDSSTLSNEYLEEMAYYLSSLILTVTPETVKYQNDTLLRYSSPDIRGILKIALDNQALKLTANGASTIFHPSTIVFGDLKHPMSVVISGTLTTYIIDKKVGDSPKSFLVGFEYRSGKVSLKTFKEVNQNDPFGEKSAVTDNSIFIQR